MRVTTPRGRYAARSCSLRSEEKINGLVLFSTMIDDDTFESCDTPVEEDMQWDPEYLAALAVALRDVGAAPLSPTGAGVHAPLSSIVRAPFFHLSKWLGAKDVVVPSGPQASFAASVFNLVNSIVGGGILALPATMSWAGLAVVCVALPLLALLMFVALHFF